MKLKKNGSTWFHKLLSYSCIPYIDQLLMDTFFLLTILYMRVLPSYCPGRVCQTSAEQTVYRQLSWNSPWRNWNHLPRYVTSSLDGNFKDVPVKADIVECLKSCNTGHPLTTISISFGIGLHTLHLHHSGEVSPGLASGGGGGAFFSSKLPLPIAKTFLRRYAMSSLWRGAWNSCVKQIVKHQSTLLLPAFVPK